MLSPSCPIWNSSPTVSYCREMVGPEVRRLYPHKILKRDETRIFIMNTLFNLAETHLIASLIDYFHRHSTCTNVQPTRRVLQSTITSLLYLDSKKLFFFNMSSVHFFRNFSSITAGIKNSALTFIFKPITGNSSAI